MKVGILGASGYTGLELIRILLRHPEFEIAVVTSEQQAGRPLGEAYPSLRGRTDLRLEAMAPAALAGRVELAFTALPTISLEQQLAIIPNTQPVTIGSLPFQIGPNLSGASFAVPGASNDYQPFVLPNPVFGNQSIMTDEVGRMYWVVDGERIGLPAPFTPFGSETLENNDQLVRAAAWSPDRMWAMTSSALRCWCVECRSTRRSPGASARAFLPARCRRGATCRRARSRSRPT